MPVPVLHFPSATSQGFKGEKGITSSSPLVFIPGQINRDDL